MRTPKRTPWPLLLLLAAAGLAGEAPEDFYQNFRGGRFQDALFQKVGADPERQVLPEAKGLRIRLPAAEKAWPPAGILPRFGMHGDFEITLSYEVLKIEPPRSGYGSGVVLWVMSGDEQQGTAAIARSHRVQEGSTYVLDRALPHADGQLRHDEQFVPTTSKFGKLRLQRTGDTLRYLAAEGNADEFRELRQEPFGTADATVVRIVADPGWSPTDVRFRTEAMPLWGTDKQARGWLAWLAAAGVLGLALAALFAVLWWRRRQCPPSAAPMAGAGKGVKAKAGREAPEKLGDGQGR
jgi:hypothetical protein